MFVKWTEILALERTICVRWDSRTNATDVSAVMDTNIEDVPLINVKVNNSLFGKSVSPSKNCVFVFVYCRQSSKQCHGSHGIPGESKMSDVEVIEGPGWWSGLVQRAWSVEFRCAIFQILIPFLLAEFNGSQD